MVALAEQKIASNSPVNGISGLALEPVRHSHGVETLWLRPGQNVIGSSSECSHVLRANGVQPRHCEIRIDSGRATLRALDFRTWLNNGPVRQVDLRIGDRLTVGPLEFRLTIQPLAEAVAPSEDVAVTAGQAAPQRQRAAEERVVETRLAETEARLLQQADEIQSRLQMLVASEDGIAQKLARIHEQELTLARRSAVLEVQAATTTAPRVSPFAATAIPARSRSRCRD
jgi:pSer/pThr/pTyr-binding forkhead associated (FHA) protein